MAPSHVAIGLMAATATGTIVGQPLDLFAAAMAAAGSLAPDIDHPRSWVGRRLPFLSRPLGMLIGHRGLTHSLVAAITASVGLSLATPPAWGQAFLVGYLSHLGGDLATSSGIPLLWPWRRRFRLLGVRTGGLGETVLVAGMTGLWLVGGCAGWWELSVPTLLCEIAK